MPNSLPPSSIWTQEPVLTPERRIWRAVLGQVYADAELATFSEDSEAVERTVARKYLRADSADEKEILELVCDFADVPADGVILWARRRYPVGLAFEKAVECCTAAPALPASG